MSHTTAAVKLNNDQRAKSLFAVLLAILASIFWGAMGVCVQYLFETSDITPLNLVSMRLLAAACGYPAGCAKSGFRQKKDAQRILRSKSCTRYCAERV